MPIRDELVRMGEPITRVMPAAFQRMQSSEPGAPGQQVRPAAHELSRARSREQEPNLVRLDQSMHFVQKLGHALDLVDEDRRTALRDARLRLASEQRPIARVTKRDVMAEEIERPCVVR